MDDAAYKKAVTEFYELYELMREEYHLQARIQMFGGDRECVMQIYQVTEDGTRLVIKVTDPEPLGLWKKAKTYLEGTERMGMFNGRIHTDYTDGLVGMERGYPEETGGDSR